MITGHGGNIKALAKILGCTLDDIIDMSSNLNPLGPPQIIEKVICDNFSKIKSLPEPDAVSMRKGFARYYGIDHARVVAGNGTTWFIYTLPQALGAKKVLIAGPTYSDYKDACIMHGVAFEHCFAKHGHLFDMDISEISRKAAYADTVFICNPDNPTGAFIGREKLEYLIQKHKDVTFIIDESYLPFVDTASENSLVSETGYKNLIVLSSMSKIFSIPGLRSGFLTAGQKIIKKIMAYYQPWSVNAMAQTVIEYIFSHPETIEPFYKKTRFFIKQEKKIFQQSLESIDGIELFDSHTCFILARLTKGMNSKDFCERIGRHKILIRDCANFSGLSDQYVRFSLKKRQVNLRLAEKIKQVLKDD